MKTKYFSVEENLYKMSIAKYTNIIDKYGGEFATRTSLEHNAFLQDLISNAIQVNMTIFDSFNFA